MLHRIWFDLGTLTPAQQGALKRANTSTIQHEHCLLLRTLETGIIPEALEKQGVTLESVRGRVETFEAELYRRTLPHSHKTWRD